MSSHIEEKDLRDQFLLSLYELSESGSVQLLDSHAVGRAAGISDLGKIALIVRYLLDHDLIEADLAAGKDANAYLTLTGLGIDEAESIRSKLNEVPENLIKRVFLTCWLWVFNNILKAVAITVSSAVILYWLGVGG